MVGNRFNAILIALQIGLEIILLLNTGAMLLRDKTFKLLLLSAKHRNPHSNSLRHNSSDDSMLVTSPLIHFLLPLVAIQPLLQA